GGRPLSGCAAGLPPGMPEQLHPVRSAVSVLAWPDGTWRRYDGSGVVVATGRGAGGGPPALAPDGSRLAWPAEYPGAAAVAFSRDGSFVYALGGGRLAAFAGASKTPRAAYTV